MNGQHLPVIEEISSEIILLNKFIGTIEIVTERQVLNETFQLKLHNITIHITGKSYVTREVSTYHLLPAILQLTPEEKERKRLLSLQMMEELNINNTKTITYLKMDTPHTDY